MLFYAVREAPVPVKILTKMNSLRYNRMMTHQDINSDTALYCIFGKPVRQSLSPVMHNRAFRETGINAVYLAFEPASAGAALQAMRSLGIRGASVTIPFKVDIMNGIDAIDPLAENIGSVNTLINDRGMITGYNTDGYGALRALGERDIPIRNAVALVLGNGGSARAIAFTLLANGARVILAGRNPEKVAGLARDLSRNHDPVESVLIRDLDRAIMDTVDIIINTTPAGMAPDTDSSIIGDELILPRHAVFDIVYSPHLTRLLAGAEKKGCTIVHGIDMLIYQGVRQFELWTGTEAPAAAMAAAVYEHRNKRA